MDKKTIRWWDWFSAVVLLAAVVTAAMRLEITDWTVNLQVVEVLTLIGGVVGLALGVSRFRPSLARVFALYFTLFFVLWQIGLWMEDNIEWPERFTSIILRLMFSTSDVFQNKPIYDPILFLTTMSLLFWVLSLAAGYQLARNGKPWVPLFLVGLTLLVIDFYAPYEPTRDRYSAAFVFFALVLAARLYLLNSRRDWSAKNVVVDPEIGYDLGRSVAIAGLALVFVAWNIPTMVQALTPGTELQKELARQWETIRDKLQNTVAGLKSPVVVVSEFFGNDLGLGTGGTLGEELVFSVQLAEKRPEGTRFYWRARSYDTYVDGQWRSSIESTRTIRAGEWPFLYPEWKARKEVNLTFTPLLASIRNLYSPGVPLSISRPAEIISRISADGTSDVMGAIASPALHSGEIFRVKAWISTPNIAILKNSGQDYPDIIKSYYLQVPRNFSRRVQNLARTLTINLTNPYDKVMAITNYLRQNITYKESVPVPPANRDPIEWFLFDIKQGFCNYYASAEVLMLRSIGIPARLAVGYAEGESEEAGNFFQVRRRDSHAWPEVYFNGIGWVEFEPTTSQPLLDLPEAEVVETLPEIEPGSNQPSGSIEPRGEDRAEEMDPDILPTTVSQNPVMYLLVVVVPVGVLAALGFLLYPKLAGMTFFKTPLPVTLEKNLEDRGIIIPGWLNQWARHTQLTPMEKLFARVNWLLIFMRIKTDPGATPSERIDNLIRTVPESREPAERFLAEYQRDEYSPETGDYERARLANREVIKTAVKHVFSRLFGSKTF